MENKTKKTHLFALYVLCVTSCIVCQHGVIASGSVFFCRSGDTTIFFCPIQTIFFVYSVQDLLLFGYTFDNDVHGSDTSCITMVDIMRRV